MIVIKKSKNGQFYFVVKAANGKVLATSETYTRKANCLNSAAALPFATNFLKDETKAVDK